VASSGDGGSPEWFMAPNGRHWLNQSQSEARLAHKGIAKLVASDATFCEMQELLNVTSSNGLRKSTGEWNGSVGNISALYSGETQLKFRPGQRLSWLKFFVVFIRSSSHMAK
jgi:hypothetical protein